MEDVDFIIKEDTLQGITFDLEYMNLKYENLKIKMINRYQVSNAVTAILTIKALRDMGYKIDDTSIYKGLEMSKWPGRFEVVGSNPYIILDGGHNIQGVKELIRGVRNYFNDKKIKIVCGMLKDKEYNDMIEELSNICDDFVTVTIDNPRALEAVEIQKQLINIGKRAIAIDDIEEATEYVLNNIDYDVVIFCGSLYLIGGVRTKLREMGYIK